MVINPHLSPDAASLKNSQTPPKASTRAAGPAATDSSAPSVDTSTALMLDSQNPPVAGPEIQDPAAADQSLNFLQDSLLRQPALAMMAQANQIPASVLELLQP